MPGLGQYKRKRDEEQRSTNRVPQGDVPVR